MNAMTRIAELAGEIATGAFDIFSLNELIINALSLVDPKRPMGTELFNALARVTVTVSIETVALRVIDEDLYVYLVKRAVNDTAYPEEYHSPGSILRPGETEIDVLRRLSEQEYGTRMSSARFIGHYNLLNEKRGHFYAPIYLVKPKGEPVNPQGMWYPINQLPEPIVEHHKQVVLPAAVRFWRFQEIAPETIELE